MQEKHKRLAQSKKNKILSLILIIFFCIILGAGNILNLEKLNRIINKQDISFQTWKSATSSVESELKNQFSGRPKLIDIYGLCMRILNKKIIGNFEFVKDNDGIMQVFGNYPDTEPFEKSILSLSKYCTENDIPLVFLQIPNKDEKLSLSDNMYFAGHISKEFMASLCAYGVDILNLRTLMDSDPDAPKRTEFFFYSDVHFTTYGEFWASKKLINHLQTQYGIFFSDLDTILDINQYKVEAFDFLGNTSRSSGKYFSKVDKFENYIPQFPTRFNLFNKQGELTRTGDFQTALMNSYEKKPHDLYTYWITNYGQYPEPYYEYQNLENINGPSILLILDSGFMRGATFLALACNKITIVDPRYMDGVPYVEHAITQNKYDAIVICGASQSFLSSSFY